MFYLVISFLCFFSSLFPLLFGLGRNLEYEYTLVALFSLYALFLLAGFLLPSLWLKSFLKESQKRKALFFLQIFVFSPLSFLLVPFFLLKTNICPCSDFHFIKWFLINLYPGFVFSYVFFHLVLLGRDSRYYKKRFLFLPFLILALSIIQSLVFFLIFPQKRQTHLLFGHLHGPIYDSFIFADFGIFLGRFSHFLFACFLLFILLKKRAFSFLFFSFFVVSYAFSFGYKSLQYGILNLEKNFTKIEKTENYTLYYNEKNQDSKRIFNLKKEAFFHITELKALLFLEGSVNIKIFLYDSLKQKKLIFGASETDVTDVFTPSIHIDADEFPHRSLRHELVHALMAKEAPLGLGFHPNMALTEGIAVALAPEESLSSLHTGAAYLLEHKKIADIKDLFSPFFWKYSGSRAYTVAGSFVKFLLEEKNASYVKKLYGTLSLKNALGDEEDLLIKNWLRLIKKNYKPKRDDLISEKYYRYPGLLEDKCPHSKVELREILEEEDYLKWRQDLERGDSYYFLRDLRSKLLAARERGEKEFSEKALESLQTLSLFEKNKKNNYDFYKLRLLMSDLNRIAGKKEKSLEILTDLFDFLQERNLGQSLSRQILARKEVEEKALEKEAYLWRLYLSGYGVLPKKHKESPWIFDYLIFRNRFFSGEINSKKSFESWQRYFSKVEPKKIFLREWLRILALDKASRGFYGDSVLFWKELSELTKGRKKELYEEYRRMFFFFKKLEIK